MELKDRILKVLDELYNNSRVPTMQELEIKTKEDYAEVLEIMEHDGLIFGTEITKSGRKKVHFVWTDNTKITTKGIEYLKQNKQD
ncbi:YjcQ family protein [Caminicella sporogenes]|uniref:YjcQ family protein n=1 Tax=Caminicella sporogenes TaxID=166485 RepID=UPI00254225A4|nr:YjcQ family protein [Caminicella sporogenes]WIF94303.1 YjcQ family protein [Caminicella sporogenes]